MDGFSTTIARTAIYQPPSASPTYIMEAEAECWTRYRAQFPWDDSVNVIYPICTRENEAPREIETAEPEVEWEEVEDE